MGRDVFRSNPWTISLNGFHCAKAKFFRVICSIVPAPSNSRLDRVVRPF